MQKMNKKAQKKKATGVAIAVIVILGIFGLFWADKQGIIDIPVIGTTAGGVPPGQDGESVDSPGGCNVLPTYTYGSRDVFSPINIGGTDAIIVNGRAPATAAANPEFGEPLTFWRNNGSSYCPLTQATVACGAHAIESRCYRNGTVTINIKNDDSDQFLGLRGATTSTTDNVTIGADGRGNLEFRYQNTAKRANFPFGGCMAIEHPSTITAITANGAGISGLTPCPYKWTYTPQTAAQTFTTFAIPAGWDSAGLGDIKRIATQLQAGASDPSGQLYFVLQPAEYYETNDGRLILGLERDANQDTTQNADTISFQVTLE